MAVEIKELVEAEFNEKVVESGRVVVVDFWAPWCGYCVRMMPVYDALAEALKDKVDFYKVNCDEQPGLGQGHSIEVLPTFAVFKDGKEVNRLIGYKTLSELQEMVEAAL